MKRKALSILIDWRNQKNRKPLVMRGVRQCGKTWLVRELGKLFDQYVEINFEKEPLYSEIFQKNLDPHRILREIAIRKGKPISGPETLLFLDEIKNCPNALLSLRYFYEDMPGFSVIGAGSLLQLAIEQVGMPVGRVDFFHVYPMSFLEYLDATGSESLKNWILTDPQLESIALHQTALEKLGEYLCVGGMPEAIATWKDTLDSFATAKIHQSLVETYKNDFPKYARKVQIKYVDEVFMAIPKLAGKKWVYSSASTHHRSRELAPALLLLESAHIAHRIRQTSATSPPLGAMASSSFKIILSDIAIMQSTLGIKSGEWITAFNRTLSNRGALVEAMVGQELVAYSDPHARKDLFTWLREKPGAEAEVDYIEMIDGLVTPIEVKAGRGDHLKSLRLYQEEKKITNGVVFSSDQKRHDKNLLRLPLYAIGTLFERSKTN